MPDSLIGPKPPAEGEQRLPDAPDERLICGRAEPRPVEQEKWITPHRPARVSAGLLTLRSSAPQPVPQTKPDASWLMLGKHELLMFENTSGGCRRQRGQRPLLHLPQARRLRPRRGAAAGPAPSVPSEAEEKPPRAAEIASKVGVSPRGRVSSASRIARRCSGVVPQQPPIIVAPLSRARTA